MYVFAFLTMDLVLALFVFFVTHVLLLGDIYSRLMMGIYIGGAIIPLYVWLGNRLGKSRAYLLGAAFWALGLVVTMFYTRETPLAVLFVGPVLMGMGQCACTFMPWAILPLAARRRLRRHDDLAAQTGPGPGYFLNRLRPGTVGLYRGSGYAGPGGSGHPLVMVYRSPAHDYRRIFMRPAV